jgi:hypothetical protein
MKAHIWLVLSRSGVVKMVKENPALTFDQRAVRLEISVPDSAFLPPATLDTVLDVPAEALSYPAITEPVRVEIWKP